MKLNAISMTTPAFKSIRYVKDNYGEDCYQFGYPHDKGNLEKHHNYREECFVEIVPLKLTDKGFEIVGNHASYKIPADGTVAIDPKKLETSSETTHYGYRYKILQIEHENKYSERKVKDIGRYGGVPSPDANIAGEYNIISKTAFKPTKIGAGVLAMPDSFAPGYVFKGFFEENPDEIGKIELNKEMQKNAEIGKRTFANTMGGTLAGYIEKIPTLKQMGYTYLFSLPITGGDSVSAFKYWPENLFQLAGGIGDMHNYRTLVETAYTNGMPFVMDAPLTSEGVSGIHYQQALRWGHQDHPMKNWFRMEGIESGQIGHGIVGKNSEGLSHYLVNAPHSITQDKNGDISIEPNPEYDCNKPTYIQYFDKDYMSAEQLEKKELIEKYEKISHENPLRTATHDDTVVKVNYILPKEDYEAYLNNINKIAEMNRTQKTPMMIDSKEGTMFASNLTKTKITEKNEAGVLTWVAHTDMIKFRYFDSPYDYKSQSSEPVDSKGLTAANCELIDMVRKYGKYWTKYTYDTQVLKTARELGNVQNASEAKNKLDNLIQNEKLDASTQIEKEALDNIDLDLYNISIPELSPETLVNKTTMNLFFESLELSKDTLGVLATQFFTDRASNSNLIGMTRYELMQEGNPQITANLEARYGYKKTYEAVNNMFKNDVYDFVMGVFDRVNTNMPADKKLFTDESKTQLTEYGYYVTKYMAEDLAKYAFIKAIVPNAQVKINSDGEIIYNTKHLRENSSLQQLGIKAHTYKLEAELLADKIKKGLNSVVTDSTDLELMKTAVLNRFKNTNSNTFKYSEAIVEKAGLGLTHRVDALKDVEDIDSKYNGKLDFNQFWPNVKYLWRQFKEGVYEYNKSGIIWDELTDSERIGGSTFDTPREIMEDSEHVSEAGYTYFFTDLMRIFTGDAAKDNKQADLGIYTQKPLYDEDAQKVISEKFGKLLEQKFPIDYSRTLYNFVGNHDKPRIAHTLMIDLELANSDLNHINNPYREQALNMLTGASNKMELPFDVRYNMNDTDYINNNYFLGASTLAIALGAVIRDNLYEFLIQRNSHISEDELTKLHNAVTLLVNGNNTIPKEERPSYLDYNTAFAEVLDIAAQNGLNINLSEKENWVNSIHKKSREIADSVDLKNFREFYNSAPSAQMLTLGNILRKAVAETEKNPEVVGKLHDAIQQYMNKYSNSYINEERLLHQKYNLNRNDNERNAFGVLDIRQAIKLVFEKAGVNNPTAEFALFKAINDPVKEKIFMIIRYLMSLPGVPTPFAGDEFCMGGYEEKTENLWLQCRNALLWSKTEGCSEEDKYYQEIIKEFSNIINLRAPNGKLNAINEGSPFYVNQVDAKDGTKVGATMFVDPEGNTAISLFNMSGLSPNSRKSYDANAQNPYIPKLNEIKIDKIPLCLGLTAGMAFKNVMENDDTIYKVVKEGLSYCIKRFEQIGGGRLKQIDIVLNDFTAKHGVFSITKKVMGSKIHFKGNSRTYYNPQYNIVSNPNYFSTPIEECGTKLSILAK